MQLELSQDGIWWNKNIIEKAYLDYLDNYDNQM